MTFPTPWHTLIAAAKRRAPQPLRTGYRKIGRAVSFVPRQWLGAITHVHTDQPAIALTFDDGPHPDSTLRLLDVLEQRGVRATFFLVGLRAQKYPALLQRIKTGKHAVANHSWSHVSFPALDSAARERQIRLCQDILGSDGVRLFRPPYGNLDLASRLDVARLGYDIVTWNVTGNDWRDLAAEEIVTQILGRLIPGSIVLLHDLLYNFEDARYASRDSMLQAIAMLLDRIGGQYRFVTVPELLVMGRPHRELWFQKGDPLYLAQLKSAES